MTVYRAAEIILYSLLAFLPCAFLALYPYRKEFRFSKVMSTFIILVACFLQVTSNLISATAQETWYVALIQTMLQALLFIFLIDTHWGKCIFSTLMLFNMGNFMVSASKCLEGLLWPSLAREPYHFTNSLALIPVELVVLIPFFFFTKKRYAVALCESKNTQVWKFIWVIPLTFYFVWFRNFYFSAEGAMVLALRPRHLIYSLIVNIGAIFIYETVIRLIHEQAVNAELREQEYRYTIQKKSYEILQDRIEEARRAKHDIRHHLNLLASLAADKKYDDLEAYIQRYQKKVPENALVYCEHYSLNALLQYFSGLAKQNNVAYSVQIEAPAQFPLPDDTLAVVVGNLLENAVEASAKEENGIVTIRAKLEEDCFFLKIVNTFSGKLRKTRDGFYLSSKHEGRGVGLRSVRGLVEEYNGILKISQEDGLFTVSVLLPLPGERKAEMS